MRLRALRPSHWIALATLVGVYAVGAVGRLDPVLLASLLPGGT